MKGLLRVLPRWWWAAGLAAGVLLVAAPALGQDKGSEAQSTPGLAHDYPTYERVRYVLECIGRNGGATALPYQCSCAIDKIAERYSIDDFVEMQTALNGMTIAGERAGVLRDNSEIRADAKRYREAEAAALKSCGIQTKR